MYTSALALAITVAILSGCSDTPGGSSGKNPSLSGGMSDEVWKAYSGTESGVTDGKTTADQGKDADQGKK